MKTHKVIELNYLQVPLTIIFEGKNGEKKEYKMIPSANKCGILIN